MADEQEARASSSSSIPKEDARLMTVEDKAVSKKRYDAQRNATRVSLMDQYTRWRDLKNYLSVKSDKELASILLDHYIANKNRRFRYLIFS